MKDTMKISPRMVMRVGPHVAAGGSAFAALRRARRSGSRLELLDAVLSIASVLTGVLLLARDLRQGNDPRQGDDEDEV